MVLGSDVESEGLLSRLSCGPHPGRHEPLYSPDCGFGHLLPEAPQHLLSLHSASKLGPSAATQSLLVLRDPSALLQVPSSLSLRGPQGQRSCPWESPTPTPG